MNQEIRYLLLDLENGRFADDPDGALRFLVPLYMEHGSFEAKIEDMEARIEELMVELGRWP